MTDHNMTDDGNNDSNNHIGCESTEAQLSEYLDGNLAPSNAQACAQHIASCAPCTQLEQELRSIVSGARSLPAPSMPRDLWPEIAARLESPVLTLPVASPPVRTAASERGPAFTRSWQFMAAAAALLVTLSASVTWSIARRGTDGVTAPALAAGNAPASNAAAGNASAGNASAGNASAGNAAAGNAAAGNAERRNNDSKTARIIDGQAVPSVATTDGTNPTDATAARSGTAGTTVSPASPSSGARGLATQASGRATNVPLAQLASNTGTFALDTLYGREIAVLRTVAESQLGLLDSSTVNVVRRNLDIIDQAIRECHTALADDPNSGFLLDQLGHAYERKVDLLRRLALL